MKVGTGLIIGFFVGGMIGVLTILRLSLIPDGAYACNMPVTYEGKKYRRLGCILIPE